LVYFWQFIFLEQGPKMKTNNKITVLLIEDDSSFRQIYLDMFKSEGYNVLVAENGEIGLDLAKEKKPDLIILDLVLPGLQGFDVLKRIRSDADTRNIPVLVATVLGTYTDVKKGLELGATDYMVKGFFGPREILVKIQSILAQANVRKGGKVKSYKVSIMRGEADAAELELYLGQTKPFTCPRCNETLLLHMIPDYLRTDTHWFLAHFICPKCQKPL
jgi:DNA-binding response OmpR family regulator